MIALLEEAATRFQGGIFLAAPDGEWSFDRLPGEVAGHSFGLPRRVGVRAPVSGAEVIHLIRLVALGFEVVVFGRREPEESLSRLSRAWGITALQGAAAAPAASAAPPMEPASRPAGAAASAAPPMEPASPPAASPTASAAAPTSPPPSASAASPVRAPEPPPGAGRIVVPTSGSTGEPRGVVHDAETLSAAARGTAAHFGFGPGDRWAVTLPLNHVGGLSILFRALTSGGTAWMPHDPQDLPAAAHGATHLSLVATQLGRLLDAWDGAPPAGLRCVMVGGSEVPVGLARRALDAGWPIALSYGLSEMGSAVTATSPGEIGSAGRVLPGRKLRIAPGGEIEAGGAPLFRGYLDGERPGSWFPTGDLGHLDRDGRLHVEGRKDNMFISGGENIHPERIERVLAAVDGVEEVIVVPVPDEEFGRRPVAFVAGSATPEALRQSALRELPSFMCPVRFLEMPSRRGRLKPQRAALARLAGESGA